MCVRCLLFCLLLIFVNGSAFSLSSILSSLVLSVLFEIASTRCSVLLKALTSDNKKEKVKVKLAENDGHFEIKQETFEKVMSKFKKSKKANYDLIVKASKSFQDGVFKFCQDMIAKEQFPNEFNATTLHMIFKGGKGKIEVLSDNRLIHSKTWMPRLAEARIVEEGMKRPLVEKSTIYQIG